MLCSVALNPPPQVIFVALVALCSRAYYAQTLSRSAENDTAVCTSGCHYGKQGSGLKYSDADVDMNNYQIPEEWDAAAIVEAMTVGDGWWHLKGVFSPRDVEMARERIYHHNKADKAIKQIANHASQDEKHNNFNGMVWALFNKGKIFEKMAQHPVVMNISNIILGENSAVSSLAANTVLPGNGGQLPHLDYPYYRMQLPSTNPHILDTAPALSLQFVTLLTDFNSGNGGTAFRPNSHHQPRYPDDKEDFYKHAIQVSGKAGDMIMFHGALQHCAMPNRSKDMRTGILQHMAPVYIKPFEAMYDGVKDEIKAKATMGLKRLLAIDHPYPMLKQ